MPKPASLAVYCGSSSGHDPRFCQAAYELGKTMAQEGITLVYGGGSVGMMGAVADGALENGGHVVGVIPTFLNLKELAHPGCSVMHEVNNMHERKALMASLSEGFIALPGGFGTLDELCEVLTWSQLGLHPWPTGILNMDGYFTPFLDCLDGMVQRGFLRQADRDRVMQAETIPGLLGSMASWRPPTSLKWNDPAVLAAMSHRPHVGSDPGAGFFKAP